MHTLQCHAPQLRQCLYGGGGGGGLVGRSAPVKEAPLGALSPALGNGGG
jgi:hypothetical protein